MLIDLTCPAEVFQISLPSEEHSAAELSLYNLSDRVIVSAEITLKMKNDRGVELEKVKASKHGLNGRPHSVFPVSILCRAHPGTETCEVIFEKIGFSDRTEWIREEGRETEYTPNDLPVSKALTDLKFVAGETAKGFPDQQDGLWVCVCGRPNPDESPACARCRQRKETVFAKYNRDAVELKVAQREKQLDLVTRSTREDLARLQLTREAAYRASETRKKRRRRLVLSFAVFLALLAAIFFVLEPALRSMPPEEKPSTEKAPTTLTMEDEIKS